MPIDARFPIPPPPIHSEVGCGPIEISTAFDNELTVTVKPDELDANEVTFNGLYFCPTE